MLNPGPMIQPGPILTPGISIIAIATVDQLLDVGLSVVDLAVDTPAVTCNSSAINNPLLEPAAEAKFTLVVVATLAVAVTVDSWVQP